MRYKEFLRASDIESILDISRPSALRIIHMFKARGQAIHYNSTYRIRYEIFYGWLPTSSEHRQAACYRVIDGKKRSVRDGQKEFITVQDIQNILDIGRNLALEISGEMLRQGRAIKLNRLLRIKTSDFYGWLSEMDHYDARKDAVSGPKGVIDIGDQRARRNTASPAKKEGKHGEKMAAP